MEQKFLKSLPYAVFPDEWELSTGRVYYQAKEIVTPCEKNVLVVTFLKMYNGPTEICRLFLSDNDFFIQQNEKIRTCELINFDWLARLPMERVSTEDTKVIQKIADRDKWETTFPARHEYYFEYTPLRGADDQMKWIAAKQRTIREGRIKSRHDLIRRRIDVAMEQINPLPEAISNWINQVPLKHSRYLIYKYKPNKSKIMDGYCTHCQKSVKIKQPKHDTSAKCPNCHSQVTLKAVGKVSSRICDEGAFAYIQPTNEGACIRSFELVRVFDFSPVKNGQFFDSYAVETRAEEMVREFLDQNGVLQSEYSYGRFMQTDEYRWCEGNEKSFRAHIYTRNLAGIWQNSLRGLSCGIYRNIDIAAIAKAAGATKPLGFFRKISSGEYLFTEGLAKIGLNRLVHNVFLDSGYYWLDRGITQTLKTHEKSPRKILGVGKSDIEMLKKADVNLAQLRLYKAILAVENKVNFEVFSQLCAMVDWWSTDIDNLRLLLCHTTSYQIAKYISMQKPIHKGRYRDIISDWIDYIADCAKLKFNLEESLILFPRDLRAEHERTTKLIEIKRNEAHERKLKARCKKLQPLVFSDKIYMIFPMRNTEDFIKESAELHHCVKTYISSCADGSKTVFACRKIEEPETPFFTVQVGEKGNLIQNRGLRNCDPSSDVKKFVEKWLKQVVKPNVALLQTKKPEDKKRVQVAV